MPIIDVKNNTRVQVPGAIDVSPGHGVVLPNTGLSARYLLKMSGIKDLVSRNLLTDTSAGSVYYIHPTTGELVTVAATEVLNHPVLGITSLPAYEQLCQDSEDPGEWVVSGGSVVRTATGETFGPFPEYNLSSLYTYHVLKIWDSTVSGSPSGTLYFSIRYNVGTSGEIYLAFIDANNDPVDNITYKGIIGSATADTSAIMTLTIFSDEYNALLGYRILTGSILFTNLSNTLGISIGSNSTDDTKTIKALGADVSEDRAILDFHVPSGPATGNVTIASRAGTVSASGLANNFPKFYDALDGAADGVELVTDGDDRTFNAFTNVNWVGYSGGVIADGDGKLKVTLEVGSASGTRLEAANLGSWGIGDVIRIRADIWAGTYSNDSMRILFEGSFADFTIGAGRKTYVKEFTATTAGTGALTIYVGVVGDNDGGTYYIDDASMQKVNPAAARHTLTYTPGQDYTDHTQVASIMTPSDADSFLRASAAGGFELSDGTNTLRWPPTVGGDIPRSLVQSIGSGATITGDVIELANEAAQIKQSAYWTLGKSYRVNVTVSVYSGTGNIFLPYSKSAYAIIVSANGVYEYDSLASADSALYVYSNPGHTATVTVNSIFELALYQFQAGVEYPMEIVYGWNEVEAAYKMQLNVQVDGTWISVIGDFDQYFEIGDPADFILGLSNPYQSSVKNHVTEKLQQAHWRGYTQVVDDSGDPIVDDNGDLVMIFEG